MSDFDEFLMRRSNKRAAEQMQAQKEKESETHIESVLKAKVSAEWRHLHDIICSLAQGKDIDGAAIREQRDSFILKNVALTFYQGLLVDGFPRNLKIIFDRNPAVYYEEGHRLNPGVWGIEPTVSNEDIVWQVDFDNRQTEVSTEHLASMVLQGLVRYCDDYESSHGR